MRWKLANRCSPAGRPIADRHYNRQSIGAKNFVPPGRCVVLVSKCERSLWVSSWPFAEYVKHAWPGAWINSTFRNEGAGLSSELIREAIAATRWYWQPPSLGMVTFIDTTKVRRKRDFGRCYRKAGFTLAACPIHESREDGCKSCQSMTKSGLVALQLLPIDMPDPSPPINAQFSFLPREDFQCPR